MVFSPLALSIRERVFYMITLRHQGADPHPRPLSQRGEQDSLLP